MKVVFKRVIMNEVLTTYLPTTLLIIIVYATTFFSAEFFEANLTVNLSVMFVMTTLFVSVMEKLPQTSYVRMVDIWMIYGQLLPFIQVVLVTYMESFRQGKFKDSMITETKDYVSVKPGTTKTEIPIQVEDIESDQIMGWRRKRNMEMMEESKVEMPIAGTSPPRKLMAAKYIGENCFS